MSNNNEEYYDDLLVVVESPLAAPAGAGVGSRPSAESYFLAKNQCMKVLVVMCRGLIDEHDGKPLLDPTEHPWNLFKPSATIKPLASDFKVEIEMRSSSSSSSPPRPGAWNLGRILKWLDDNPIVAVDDVEFLTKTVLLKKKNSIAAFEAIGLL